MPLVIQNSTTPPPAPTSVTASRMRLIVTGAGVSLPAGRTVVGFTLPFISDDHTGIHYDTRTGGTQFRFRTGTLKLTLRHEVYLLDTLSPCARAIWLQHELKHAADNQRIMGRMDGALRADGQFSAVLVNPTAWLPRSNFAATQTMLHNRIGVVFTRFTSTAVSHLDTAAEYTRVERQIRARCGGRIDRVLRQGVHGHGVDIVQVALNAHPPTSLPRLVPDGIFGAKTTARVVEFQRNQTPPLDDDGVVGTNTRGALGV